MENVKSSKRISTFLSVLLTIFFFAACSGGGGPTGPSSTGGSGGSVTLDWNQHFAGTNGPLMTYGGSNYQFDRIGGIVTLNGVNNSIGSGPTQIGACTFTYKFNNRVDAACGGVTMNFDWRLLATPRLTINSLKVAFTGDAPNSQGKRISLNMVSPRLNPSDTAAVGGITTTYIGGNTWQFNTNL